MAESGRWARRGRVWQERGVAAEGVALEAEGVLAGAEGGVGHEAGRQAASKVLMREKKKSISCN
uniref:DUF834 domain-containing protein n=1 Tax=Oryza rufipogon TaxID=4529 RepID=A0A0E0PB18_ORYRU